MKIKACLIIPLIALTVSCRAPFAGYQAVVLQEPGNPDLAVAWKPNPGTDAVNTVKLPGRLPQVIPADTTATIQLDPANGGPQTVILQAGAREVQIRLLPLPRAAGGVPGPAVPDSAAGLEAQCRQAALDILSNGLITPGNARIGRRQWAEWRAAHQSFFDASPGLRNAYQDVLSAIRMQTAGDPD